MNSASSAIQTPWFLVYTRPRMEHSAQDNLLRSHPAVIATPHSASITREGRRRMEEMAMARLLAFFRGERPPDVVNAAAWPPSPAAR